MESPVQATLNARHPPGGRVADPTFRPLAGVRVLDLSRLLPGPFLTQLLADLGADVVKVEEPGVGDHARWTHPEVDGAGYAFAAVNRGKRSIPLDLKKPGGVEVARRLAARADVLVESFRPGVMDRLGLGDAALEALNPRLVRVSLVGYPPGPLRGAPGHDLNYESVSGILAAQGEPGRPMPGAAPLGDVAGALYAAAGLLAALLERGRTGRGRRVEVALSEAALAANALLLARARADPPPAPGEPPPEPGPWDLSGTLVCYRLYRCADGAHAALACLEPKFWSRFVEASGRPDLEALHLDASPDAHRRLEAAFAARPLAAWLDLAARHGVPLTPVLAPRDALAAATARLGGPPGPGTPLTGRPSAGPVPALGGDVEAILAEAGYGPEAAARLRADGVLGSLL